MPSFQITILPNRRAAARFVTQVRRGLQKAFEEEQKKRGLSQADIARAIGVNRSVINRELKGFKDITLGRVAELAWAIGRKPAFSLDQRIAAIGQNTLVVSALPTSTPINKVLSEELVQADNNHRFLSLRTEARAA